MNVSSFKGKTVKDYEMGQTLTMLDQKSEIIQGLKGKSKHVTVYALKKSDLDPQKFVAYNNAIGENLPKVYPVEIELVQSEKFIYMIFEQIKKPEGPLDPYQVIKQLQTVFRLQKHKINREEILMKGDTSLCYLPSYFKLMGPNSIYSQIHNKKTLATVFCDVVESSNKQKVTQILLNDWDDPKIMELLQPYMLTYPDLDDDDSEIMALMSQARVNPDMMKEAGQQYVRASTKQRQGEHSQQISGIFNNVKESMYDFKAVKGGNNKSKYQVKINDKKYQKMEFEVYFQKYTQIFKLFKKTIKSFLTKFPKGFTGIIAAYLINLICILRKLQLICDLQNNQDVFSLTLQYDTDFTKELASLKKELIGEGKMLVNLRQIIENSQFPLATFQTLMPYLDNIENIDRVQAQNFCFFYMTVILRKTKNHDYHSLLSIETMSVLLHRNYEIVYSEEDFPTKWDPDYFDMRKILIESTVSKWSID